MRRVCYFQVHTLFGVTEIVVALSLVCQRDKLGSPEMQRGVEDAQKNQINKNRDEGQRREQVVSTDPDCRTVGIQVFVSHRPDWEFNANVIASMCELDFSSQAKLAKRHNEKCLLKAQYKGEEFYINHYKTL